MDTEYAFYCAVNSMQWVDKLCPLSELDIDAIIVQGKSGPVRPPGSLAASGKKVCISTIDAISLEIWVFLLYQYNFKIIIKTSIFLVLTPFLQQRHITY